jgi:hypothetical protein
MRIMRWLETESNIEFCLIARVTGCGVIFRRGSCQSTHPSPNATHITNAFYHNACIMQINKMICIIHDQSSKRQKYLGKSSLTMPTPPPTPTPTHPGAWHLSWQIRMLGLRSSSWWNLKENQHIYCSFLGWSMTIDALSFERFMKSGISL